MTRSTNSRGLRWLGVSACVALVCVASYIAGARPAQAGINVWTSNGPEGVYVGALAVDPTTPTTLYAGTENGRVFKSADGGGTWNAAHAGLTSPYPVRALAIDPTAPTTLYAATSDWLYKSTDGAGTWSTTGLPSQGVWALAIDPETPTTLYAGTFNGVFKSTDSGSTWGATGPVDGDVDLLAIDPTNSTTLYAHARGSGIFKSTDAGTTWDAANAGLPDTFGVVALVIDPITPGILYAGGYGGVFKSADGALTWNASGLTEVRVAVLAIDPTTSTTLYAGALGGGVFKSTDGGGTWSATGLRPNADVNALAINPATPTTVYAGTSWAGGALKSTDGGSTWMAINTGLPRDLLGASAVAVDRTHPTRVYANTLGVFRSTDHGDTWSAFDAGLTNAGVEALAIDPTTPSTLYAGSDGGVFGVSKSTDGGRTWVAANTGLEDGYPGDYPPGVLALAIDPAASTTLYAGTRNGVFKSTDGAGTWRNVLRTAGGSDIPSISSFPVLAIDPIISTTLYAAPDSGCLFKSTDGGDTWLLECLGLPEYPLSAVAIDPTTPTTLYAGTWYGVYKSTDGGDTWNATALTSPDRSSSSEYALVIDPNTPTTLYAGTIDPSLLTGPNNRGVFKSTDGGGTWSTLNTGLSDWRDLRINTLAIDPIRPTRLYAGTDTGVFSIDQVSVCVGDCAVDGRVTINEIITMINIALGTGSMAECGSGDTNHDNQVSIDEILAAVNGALYGCPAPPMPTPRFLTEDATLYDYWPSFSPDSRSLLFSRTADGVHWELRQVPVAGGPSSSFASTPLAVSATRANWASRACWFDLRNCWSTIDKLSIQAS
jgi:photosystem II stability/assembly factor-like uncharacterized protein